MDSHEDVQAICQANDQELANNMQREQRCIEALKAAGKGNSGSLTLQSAAEAKTSILAVRLYDWRYSISAGSDECL